MKRALLVLSLALCACGPTTDPGLTVLTGEDTRALVDKSLEFIPDERLHAVTVGDPLAELHHRGGFVIAVRPRSDCTECYRLSVDGGRVLVEGGMPLGVQYGLAHALEGFGYGFFHPWQTHVPETLAAPNLMDGEHTPRIGLRGLHLHTLHPIEALYDFWIPGDANLEGARRTLDFIIKNRGNYVQWAGLDDITADGPTQDAWRAHTRAITAEAHARGLRTGIGVELFGQANLQNAFDLIDDTAAPDLLPEMERRLHVLLDGNGFDKVNLSFGEFFAADPADFVQYLDDVYAETQKVQPGVDVPVLIHVGNYPDLRVTYMGETLLYYFLVKFADPHLVPWVHTTMYYDLYEDAGGAYLHDEFNEHRDYIEGKLKAGERVGYFPEDAYWVAFDNCVPTYLPLYMRSRWLDLTRLEQVGPLPEHVLFSTGFEWGYWQNDAAGLRMTYELPARWNEPIEWLFSVYGDTGTQLAAKIHDLGEREHQALIIDRLAPYLAGRDQLIDAGDKLGIFSQPDRWEFSEVAAMTPAERAAFVTNVLDKLKAFAGDLKALSDQVQALDLPKDPFLDEAKDGFEVTAHRAAFIHALYRATVEYADTGSDAGWLDVAEAELAKGKDVVARRRQGLHDPDIKPILRNTDNPTFYKYGYLREADQLCFWERERAQARNLIVGGGLTVPGCVL